MSNTSKMFEEIMEIARKSAENAGGGVTLSNNTSGGDSVTVHLPNGFYVTIGEEVGE